MTDAPRPVLFILHGDDTHAMRAYVQALVDKMGDPAMADLNTTRLDGRQAADEALRSAVAGAAAAVRGAAFPGGAADERARELLAGLAELIG